MIDLVIRRVSVGLGAPQSIHNIETLSTDNSVHLLVSLQVGKSPRDFSVVMICRLELLERKAF